MAKLLTAHLEKWLYKEDLADLHKAIYGNMGGSMNKKQLVEAVTKGNPRKVLQKVAVADMRVYYRDELGREPLAKPEMVNELEAVLLGRGAAPARAVQVVRQDSGPRSPTSLQVSIRCPHTHLYARSPSRDSPGAQPHCKHCRRAQ